MKPIKLTLAAFAAVIAVASLNFAVTAQKNPGPPPRSNPPASAINEKAGAATWLTDFAAAQQQAKAAHKFILLDFTGSDWCPWCMKLDREIFATPEFSKFAGQQLVLVKVDFPRHHAQSAAEQAQNEKLAAQFQVSGFPTLVVLNPDGHESGTLGYMSGGPQPFIDELTKVIAGT